MCKLQGLGNYKKHVGKDYVLFPFLKITLIWGQGNHKDIVAVFAIKHYKNGIEARSLDSYNDPDNEQGTCAYTITFKSHNSSARKVAFDPFGGESSGPEMLSSWPKFIQLKSEKKRFWI